MPGTVRTIAVIGSGYMGGGIAQVFATAGFTVLLADQNAAAAAAARERLVAQSREFEARELFAPGAADAVSRHLRASNSVEEAAGEADLVIEAVFEDVDVKSDVLRRVSAHAGVDTIIGTNTSSISVDTLKPAVASPERFLTIHFFNPAPFVPGAEVVASEDTDSSVVEIVAGVLERAGKRPAVVGDTPGMVVNRIQYAMVSEAFRVVEEGVASMEAIDTLVRNSFGFRLGLVGPFSMVDQAGVDVYAKCFGILREAFGDRMAPPAALEAAVDDGALGMKSGRGLLGEYDDDVLAAIQGYRDHAYVRMQGLQDELGPPPAPRNTQN